MTNDLQKKLKKLTTDSKKSTGSFFTSMGFPLLILIVMSYLFSYGFVAFKLWNWFALPVIAASGVAKIGTIIGMFLLVKLVTSRINFSLLLNSKEEEEIGLEIVTVFGFPWLVLFVGFIVKFLLL